MKALRTKVILSGIVLVFAFIATIGTTFAWFTVSDTVTVDNMQLNVTTEDNLLIQVFDPIDDNPSSGPTLLSEYGSSVTLAQIEAEYGDLSTYQLTPVTALQDYATPLIDGRLLKSISALDSLRAISGTAPTANATDGDYIQIKFWLYSQSDSSQQIELTGLNINVTGLSSNDSDQNAVANALRMAVYLDSASTGAGAYIFGNDTDFGFTWTASDPGYYDPVADTSNTGDTEDLTYGFNSLNAIGITTAGGELETSVTNYANVLLNNDQTDILTINPQSPTLVTVNIYIEGWDISTTNLIMDANVNIEFGFKFEGTDNDA